jgi:hypothetical protein
MLVLTVGGTGEMLGVSTGACVATLCDGCMRINEQHDTLLVYLYYTPSQNSGYDFTPSQVKTQTCVDSVDKSHESIGNALAPKMECADSYRGRNLALPGLCTWGYRSRTRAARSFKSRRTR